MHRSISIIPGRSHFMDRLLIYGQNVNGLRSKLTAFKLNVLNMNADIYLITETNLGGDVSDAEVCDLSMYRVFRRDRESAANIKNKKSGGGVLIAVRNRLDVVQQLSFQSEAEDLWITVSSRDGSLRIHSFIYVAYICHLRMTMQGRVLLPSTSFEKFGGDQVVIFGDFNFPGVDWISSECNNFYIPLNTDNSCSPLFDMLAF